MRQGRHEALSRGYVIAAAAALAAVAAYAGARALRARQKRLRPVFDYSDRSGFPKPAEQMRGIARNRGQSPVSVATSA
ncbi:MAG TPA: hypothetical protein VFZ84_15905 [Burkholderiales bacterium]